MFACLSQPGRDWLRHVRVEQNTQIEGCAGLPRFYSFLLPLPLPPSSLFLSLYLLARFLRKSPRPLPFPPRLSDYPIPGTTVLILPHSTVDPPRPALHTYLCYPPVNRPRSGWVRVARTRQLLSPFHLIPYPPPAIDLSTSLTIVNRTQKSLMVDSLDLVEWNLRTESPSAL